MFTEPEVPRDCEKLNVNYNHASTTLAGREQVGGASQGLAALAQLLFCHIGVVWRLVLRARRCCPLTSHALPIYPPL